MSAARLERIHVARGGRAVLVGADLELSAGRVHVLAGASGSGKTTLLRLLAGLEVPDAGRISIGGRVVTDGRSLLVPPHARGVSFAFQDGALWEHLTVEQHLRFGLDAHVPSAAEREERVAEALRLAELESRRRERPGPLSGGERARLSIARAIVHRSALLLLDEPLAHLDHAAQRTVTHRLGEWIARHRPTVLWVTHQPQELSSAEAAIEIARVFTLRSGRIVPEHAPVHGSDP